MVTTKIDLKSALGPTLAEVAKLEPDGGWEQRDAEVQKLIDAKRREDALENWKATKARLLDRGLAERHLEVLFKGDVKQTPALDAINAFGGDGICIISGNVGCGKTLAAHSWLLDAANVEPRDWSARGIRMVTAAWFARTSRYANREEDKFNALTEPRRLVVDDLGVEFNDEKGSFRVDVDELLDLRWRAKLPTVITTNLASEEFKERYGLRLYDRARGQGTWQNVKHESLRG